MRNYLFLFALLLPTFSYAQAEIGFRVGVNMAELNYEAIASNPLELTANNGIQFSTTTNFRIARYFSIQPELVFSQKGYMYKEDGSNFNSFLSNYLELPLLLELSIPLGETFQIYGDAGPNLSYLVNATQKLFDINTNEYTQSKVDFDAQEELERVDYGFNFGGGFSIRVKRNKFTFDVRYNMGLNDIMNVDSTQAAFQLARNKVTNFAVGYSYILFGKKK